MLALHPLVKALRCSTTIPDDILGVINEFADDSKQRWKDRMLASLSIIDYFASMSGDYCYFSGIVRTPNLIPRAIIGFELMEDWD